MDSTAVELTSCSRTEVSWTVESPAGSKPFSLNLPEALLAIPLQDGTALRNVPIIGFDMGETSTDVSGTDGYLEHTFNSRISGVNISVPLLDINTAAAGGGSMLSYKNIGVSSPWSGLLSQRRAVDGY